MADRSSDSVEMYVKRIAVLQAQNGDAVPLSILAADLSILPTSANEMCRRLAADGLVDYRPYKGVTLTAAGQMLAKKILCRQRLWECFLVDTLGFDVDLAEQSACELEHATSELLAARLAQYLDYPTLSPRNQPIPCAYGSRTEPVTALLSSLEVGQKGQVDAILAEAPVRDLLLAQGLTTGAPVGVLSIKPGVSVLLELGGQYLSLAVQLAEQVSVALVEGAAGIHAETRSPVATGFEVDNPQTKEKKAMQNTHQITLDRLPIGGRGVIVQVGGGRAVKRRMMDMGLVTGETITLKGVAPMGNPLEFIIKGYQLSLRKNEAQNVVVELLKVGHEA